MKLSFLVYLSFFYSVKSLAQKSLIDSSVFGKWPMVLNPVISNDGHFASYTINNLPVRSNTLIIQSLTNHWKKTYSGCSNANITADNKLAIFKKGVDTLYILKLGTDDNTYLGNVSSYKLPKDGSGEWLAYQLKNSSKDIVLLNLLTRKEKRFPFVADYIFSDDGKVLLLQTEDKNGNSNTHSLEWVSLPEANAFTIWQGQRSGRYAFDLSSTQLVFIAEEKTNNRLINTLWYYKAGMSKCIIRANGKTEGIGPTLEISNRQPPKFNKDGNRIFFTLQQKENDRPNLTGVQVDVWNYTDSKLQSQQIDELNHPSDYIAVINNHENRVVQLTHEDEVLEMGAIDKNNVDFVLVNYRKGDSHESNWNLASQPSFFLVSTTDGSRKAFHGIENLTLSSYGKYILYYDYSQKNYFCYEIVTGLTKNITKGIHTRWTLDGYDNPDPQPPVGLFSGVTWLEEDEGVLIYDNYDIWQVDPTGNKLPINITNGYGSKHKIVFRLTNYNNLPAVALSEPKQSEMLLTALNKKNKYNGFFFKKLGTKGDPELLTMGPYIYHSPWVSYFLPLKARNADQYLVRRMSTVDAPNYYVTSDFKTYTSLTNIQPQKEFNWMTSELVRWRTFDGSLSEGILYKPENFDPRKKYPVIFNFYEKMSNRLYQYIEPASSNSNINIPWFVSHGYLVFTPDIQYKIGEPGESAYNSIVSAAKYLSKIVWVDSTKMAIQGHSFGGYEVNYLSTRTNCFAAAASGAGPTNLISDYGGLWWGGINKQWVYETNQCRIGANLWQRPDLYIKNSPVLKADKVCTPLLILHNKEDESVAWSQGVEFFTALRRLGSKTWMLQYDGEDHGISGKNQVDYHIRLAQFFDHYLKSAPAPVWMTRGIPARLKQIETGYAYDPSHRCGKDCKVCRYWNEKYKKDSAACWKEIEERKKSEHWQ